MPTIKYDIGEPTTELRGFTHYVDLYTDIMYMQSSGRWVIIAVRGVSTDEQGNPLEFSGYSYD